MEGFKVERFLVLSEIHQNFFVDLLKVLLRILEANFFRFSHKFVQTYLSIVVCIEVLKKFVRWDTSKHEFLLKILGKLCNYLVVNSIELVFNACLSSEDQGNNFPVIYEIVFKREKLVTKLLDELLAKFLFEKFLDNFEAVHQQNLLVILIVVA